MDIYSRVVEIIASQLQLDPETINENSTIIEDLGADSLDVVEMLMTFEEQFNISVPDEILPDMRKVSDLVEYLEENA
jgi:acyl carrier protein